MLSWGADYVPSFQEGNSAEQKHSVQLVPVTSASAVTAPLKELHKLACPMPGMYRCKGLCTVWFLT